MMGLKRKCRVHMLGRILGFALCCGLPGPVDAQAQYHHLDVAVHASSWYSTGSAHIEEVAQAAAAMGFDALILTDADVLQVEYGLPFFRNIFAFSSEQPALLSENALGDYLAEIQRVDETMENFVLIDGVESRPFYFWSNIFGGGPWQLQHWNKRQIAVGLGSAEAYAGLPVSGGDGIWGWHWTSILLLWPMAGLAFALVADAKPLWLRAAVGAISLLCLVNNMPFKVPLWGAYNGDLGPAPFQQYIDEVNQRGGLVFWVAPDKRETVELFGGRIGAVCPPSTMEGDLLHTFDYTGFAALHAGHSRLAEPGQAWDRALHQYLLQERARPPWGIGDANYQGGALAGARTIVLARERSRRGVLEALRSGRMYATMGEGKLALEQFAVVAQGEQGLAGQHIESSGLVRVQARVAAAEGTVLQLRLRLVRSGEVIAEQTGMTPLSFAYVDKDIGPGQRVYYRLLINSQSDRLVSNPIFVRKASR